MQRVNCLSQVFILGTLWIVADAFAVHDVNLDEMNSRMHFVNNQRVHQHLSNDLRHSPSDMVISDVCTEDYSPCYCMELDESNALITCEPEVTVEQIQEVFNRTQTLDLYKVFLKFSMPSSGAIHLPANLLSDKRVSQIEILCPYTGDLYVKGVLTLDPATFQLTRSTTTYVSISNCDFASQTDMQFLNGFSVLNTLSILGVNNFECLSTLPTATLPALKDLTFNGVTGLQNVAFPDLTPARLELLNLEANVLDDATVNGIFLSIGNSSSASSLATLRMMYNFLTVIPSTAAFSKLDYLDIKISSILFISQSSLVFSAPVRRLDLQSNYIGEIEAGAFQIGDYSMGAVVDLSFNQLTEFREDVFLSVLQQMANTIGYVAVLGNQFDCGCGLAWLIRDNRALMSKVIGGECHYSRIYFENLNPESYANCTY